jgi:excisionase family DNA binding protein
VIFSNSGPWLTSDQASAYLGLSRRALYQAIRRGQIPAHRIGNRRLRFNRIELDHALSSSSSLIAAQGALVE